MPTEEPTPNPDSRLLHPAPGYVQSVLTTLYEQTEKYLAVNSVVGMDPDFARAIEEARDVLRRFYGPKYHWYNQVSSPPIPLGLGETPPPLRLHMEDAPQANQNPDPKGSQWTYTGTLDDGRTLFLLFGEKGRDTMLNLFAMEARDEQGEPLYTPESVLPDLVRLLGNLLEYGSSGKQLFLPEGAFRKMQEEAANVLERATPLVPDCLASLTKKARELGMTVSEDHKPDPPKREG